MGLTEGGVVGSRWNKIGLYNSSKVFMITKY